jgi:hypothetical protein
VIDDRGGSQTQARATVTVAAPPSSTPPSTPPSTPSQPPAPPLAASVVTTATSGPAASVTIACQGPAGQTCTGTAVLSSVERKRGRSIVAVSALKRVTVRTSTVTVTLASRAFAVAVGQRATLQINLSATGKRLLAMFYTLPASLSLAGTSAPTRTITFAYPRITSIYNYTIDFNPNFSTVRSLSVAGLPKGAQVTVSCRGRGCPFRQRVLKPHDSQASFAGLFKGARLAPGTIIELAITAPNH